MIALTGAAVAVAVVIFFASGAAAGRHPTIAQSGPGRWPTTTAGLPSDGHTSAPSRPDGRPGGRGPRLTAVSPAIGLRSGAASPIAAGYGAAMAALPKLSVAQLAGQRVIYSYRGLTPPAGLLTLISHGEAAGVIFFSDNVGSGAADLANFKHVVSELSQAAASPHNPVHEPLLLMTDQEGGLVRRLPGAPAESEKQIGESANPSVQATRAGRGAAANLHGFGLDVNLAPVLDVFRRPGNFIDEFQRSYSNDPRVVARLGAAFVTAQQKGGVAATVKHFPGLGAARRSQNTDMRPVTLNLPLSQIRGVDELPYKSVIALKPSVDLVMASWAIYPALDSRFPAGLSKTIVQGELRTRLGFGGVTITDALEAGALNPFGSTANRATLATRAGMDLLLCAAENFRQGQTAMRTLASNYQRDSASAKAAFKAAAERVIALRTVLVGG